MPTRTQTYKTSTVIGLLKRSHAPELTLDLTSFPLLNGTRSPLRAELLGMRQGQEAAGRLPSVAKQLTRRRVQRLPHSPPRSAAGKGHKQCAQGEAGKTKRLKNDIGNWTETQQDGGTPA